MVSDLVNAISSRANADAVASVISPPFPLPNSDTPPSGLSSTSRSHRSFFEFGRRGRDTRRRLADSLQRSLFIKSGKRDSNHDEGSQTLRPENDTQTRSIGTNSSRSFIVNRSHKPLPRTPSKLDRSLPTHKPSQEDSILKRFMLDSSQTRSSGTKTPKKETPNGASGSAGKTSFGKGIRNSFLGLLGRNRGEEDHQESPVKLRDDQRRKHHIRSMGLSYETLKGVDGNRELVMDRRRNASMIELKIGNP